MNFDQVHIRDEGDGVPVLLVHGLGASSRVFDVVFARRPEGVRLVTFDLPRTARSGHWAPSRPEAIADRLVEFLWARGLSRVHLFGHSFGALVCLSLAERHGAVPMSLTLASAPVLGLPAELRLLLSSPWTDITCAFWGVTPVARPLLHAYLAFIWGRPDTLHGQDLLVYEDAQTAEGFGDGVLEALRAIGDFRFEAEIPRRASYAKRLVWGDRDPLVPVGTALKLAEAIGAELEVLPAVGHCLPDERPDVVQALVARCVHTSGGPVAAPMLTSK